MFQYDTNILTSSYKSYGERDIINNCDITKYYHTVNDTLKIDYK